MDHDELNDIDDFSEFIDDFNAELVYEEHEYDWHPDTVITKEDLDSNAVSTYIDFTASTDGQEYYEIITSPLFRKKHKILNYFQCEEAFVDYKNGNPNALTKLVLSNVRRVVYYARKYYKSGVPIEDRISYGIIGLIQGINKCDVDKWYALDTKVSYYIRNSIKEGIQRQTNSVNIPTSYTQFTNKAMRAANVFEHENLRPPSVEELAKILDVPSEYLWDTLRCSRNNYISTDFITACFEDVDDAEDYIGLIGYNQVDEEMESESLSIEIERALCQLRNREKEILKMFFGIGGYPEMSLDQIGERYDLSRERVRQIKEKAIRRLKCSKKEMLREYVAK